MRLRVRKSGEIMLSRGVRRQGERWEIYSLRLGRIRRQALYSDDMAMK